MTVSNLKNERRRIPQGPGNLIHLRHRIEQ